MTFIRTIRLIFVILVFSVTGMPYAQVDGERIGEVKQIDQKRGQLIVSSTAEIKMGEVLYLRIDGKVVKLRAIFPMQSLCTCRAEDKNRGPWANTVIKMPVFRWNKDIEDITILNEPALKPENPRDKMRNNMRMRRGQ